MRNEEPEATVTLGDGVAMVRRRGSSALAVANVLGTTVADDKTAIYLDRLVHKSHESSLGSFLVKGATTTILITSD